MKIRAIFPTTPSDDENKGYRRYEESHRASHGEPIKILLHHRTATERAGTAEGCGQTRILSRVKKNENQKTQTEHGLQRNQDVQHFRLPLSYNGFRSRAAFATFYLENRLTGYYTAYSTFSFMFA
jgi:hypothetical protein